MMNLITGDILASYTLFRELYNNNCKDIYDIVVEFIRDVIVTNNRYSFTLKEITYLVNNTFGFMIPDYVIAPSIMKIDGAEKREGTYFINVPINNRNSLFEKEQNEVIKQNNLIISDLYIYIEEIKGCILTAVEKDKILNSFYGFLLDEVNGHEYSELISAFVLKNKANTNFVNKLASIREGVVLYAGINYNNRINEVGTWKNEMTIYLEMEILFHIAGYNGIIFKELADELLSLIGSIRTNKNIRLIKMRYFNETKSQIERFFDKATYIVTGQSVLASDNIAMKEIINGCKTAADILDKKSDFYLTLNNKGIVIDEEEKNYYISNLNQYNLEDAATLEEFSSSDNEDSEEIHKRLKFISNIHKLRKGQVKGDYADCGYLLITNTTRTLKMSKTLSTQNKTVPYAINMATLTNLLWNRLNKGFGAKNFPKTIDVIIKAQIILSKFVNDSVGESYLKLKEEVKSSSITEDQMLSRLASLRSLVKKPEDITDIDETLLFITEDKIDKYFQEQELYKNKAIESEKKNSALEQEVQIYKSGFEALKEKLVIKDNIELDKKKMDMINTEIATLRLLKEKLDTKAKSMYRNFKAFSCIGIILFYGIYVTIIAILGWSAMEMVTYFIGLLPFALGLIYTLIYTKSFNFISCLKMINENCKKKVYKGNEELDEIIEKNILMITSLKYEIDKSNKKLEYIDKRAMVENIE